MFLTYKARLRGNQLEWQDSKPQQLEGREQVDVYVTILGETQVKERKINAGPEMASTLKQISLLTSRSIIDPSTWERELRKDRPLPNRQQ